MLPFSDLDLIEFDACGGTKVLCTERFGKAAVSILKKVRGSDLQRGFYQQAWFCDLIREYTFIHNCCPNTFLIIFNLFMKALLKAWTIFLSSGGYRYHFFRTQYAHKVTSLISNFWSPLNWVGPTPGGPSRQWRQDRRALVKTLPKSALVRANMVVRWSLETGVRVNPIRSFQCWIQFNLS